MYSCGTPRVSLGTLRPPLVRLKGQMCVRTFACILTAILTTLDLVEPPDVVAVKGPTGEM